LWGLARLKFFSPQETVENSHRPSLPSLDHPADIHPILSLQVATYKE
jgi:hypothetical protein